MLIINFLKKYKILLTIILIASILRLWNLQSFPPHLRNDEAALGYNAYSILNTGKDEHGEFLPAVFQSFGDWKPGLYVYLTIPFVYILGLTETSVRLASAIAGIVSVLLIYGIVFQLFKKELAAQFCAFLLSVSPILMPFSRGAWEVNVSLALTLAGIYFFLISFKDNRFFLLSAVAFGLTLLCSHGAKFSTPAILVLLIIIFFKEFKKISRQKILLGLFIIFILACPIILSFIQGKVLRLTTLSIFSYPSSSEWPVIYYTKAILSRWLSLYSFKSLFFSGDLNPQHGVPNMGPFLLMDSLFLFLGFIKVVRMGLSKQTLFIFALLAFLALPSALTIEKANFERVLTLFIPFLIIEALGIVYFWEKVKGKKWLLVVVIALYISNYVYFLDQFFIHGSKKNDAWQYGYKQIVEKVTPLQAKYPHIIVAQSLEQPYIFFLFYQKHDPRKYQQISDQVFVPNKEGKDMGTVSEIDNIKFEDINWKEKVENKSLYVMPKYLLDKEMQFYSSYKEVDTIYDLNGFPLFKFVETR